MAFTIWVESYIATTNAFLPSLFFYPNFISLSLDLHVLSMIICSLVDFIKLSLHGWKFIKSYILYACFALYYLDVRNPVISLQFHPLILFCKSGLLNGNSKNQCKRLIVILFAIHFADKNFVSRYFLTDNNFKMDNPRTLLSPKSMSPNQCHALGVGLSISLVFSQ